jgi:hypothetical protein
MLFKRQTCFSIGLSDLKGGALPHMAAFPNTKHKLSYLVLVGVVLQSLFAI